jgi:putative membrane protein
MTARDGQGPVLIEIEPGAGPAPDPAAAPPVPDPAGGPEGRAMQAAAAAVAARPAGRLWRWFLRLGAAFAVFVLGLWAWDFAAGLMARSPWLGRAGLALMAALALAALALAAREWLALARLGRLDGLSRQVRAARAAGSLDAARSAAAGVTRLYAGRPELQAGAARFAAREGEILDGPGLLDHAERCYLAPLDAAARREVEAAARQVATVTALVPLTLADVAAALVANLAMMRRVAEIYGGRSGAIGSWRLLRAVLAHLVATGALAAGDDLIGSVAGGGLLSKLSRRFGEGLVNGALTARVGVAAMEVCRPMPFAAERRPAVASLVQRALAGLFARGQSPLAGGQGRS